MLIHRTLYIATTCKVCCFLFCRVSPPLKNCVIKKGWQTLIALSPLEYGNKKGLDTSRIKTYHKAFIVIIILSGFIVHKIICNILQFLIILISTYH